MRGADDPTASGIPSPRSSFRPVPRRRKASAAVMPAGAPADDSAAALVENSRLQGCAILCQCCLLFASGVFVPFVSVSSPGSDSATTTTAYCGGIVCYPGGKGVFDVLHGHPALACCILVAITSLVGSVSALLRLGVLLGKPSSRASSSILGWKVLLLFVLCSLISGLSAGAVTGDRTKPAAGIFLLWVPAVVWLPVVAYSLFKKRACSAPRGGPPASGGAAYREQCPDDAFGAGGDDVEKGSGHDSILGASGGSQMPPPPPRPAAPIQAAATEETDSSTPSDDGLCLSHPPHAPTHHQAPRSTRTATFAELPNVASTGELTPEAPPPVGGAQPPLWHSPSAALSSSSNGLLSPFASTEAPGSPGSDQNSAGLDERGSSFALTMRTMSVNMPGRHGRRRSTHASISAFDIEHETSIDIPHSRDRAKSISRRANSPMPGEEDRATHFLLMDMNGGEVGSPRKTPLPAPPSGAGLSRARAANGFLDGPPHTFGGSAYSFGSGSSDVMSPRMGSRGSVSKSPGMDGIPDSASLTLSMSASNSSRGDFWGYGRSMTDMDLMQRQASLPEGVAFERRMSSAINLRQKELEALQREAARSPSTRLTQSPPAHKPLVSSLRPLSRTASPPSRGSLSPKPVSPIPEDLVVSGSAISPVNKAWLAKTCALPLPSGAGCPPKAANLGGEQPPPAEAGVAGEPHPVEVGREPAVGSEEKGGRQQVDRGTRGGAFSSPEDGAAVHRNGSNPLGLSSPRAPQASPVGTGFSSHSAAGSTGSGGEEVHRLSPRVAFRKAPPLGGHARLSRIESPRMACRRQSGQTGSNASSPLLQTEGSSAAPSPPDGTLSPMDLPPSTLSREPGSGTPHSGSHPPHHQHVPLALITTPVSGPAAFPSFKAPVGGKPKPAAPFAAPPRKQSYSSFRSLESELPRQGSFNTIRSMASRLEDDSSVISGALELIAVADTRHVRKSTTADGIRLLNDYEILRDLGSGSFSKVRLCRDRRTGEYRAMKIVKKSLMRNLGRLGGRGAITATALQKVKQEIAIMKKIRHKNLVTLYEVIDDPDTDKLILVMENVARGCVGKVDVHTGLLTTPTLTEEQLRKMLAGVVQGLRYLHRCRVLHRDVKPENILINSDGTAKLTDFGVSHVWQVRHGDTIKHTEGTPVYFPPEALNGGDFRGIPADTWALGVTCYVLTLGKLPFHAASRNTLHEAILKQPVLLPRTLDASLADLVTRMLRKDHRARPSPKDIRNHGFISGREASAISSAECSSGPGTATTDSPMAAADAGGGGFAAHKSTSMEDSVSHSHDGSFGSDPLAVTENEVDNAIASICPQPLVEFGSEQTR
eukprot:gene7292-11251_t